MNQLLENLKSKLHRWQLIVIPLGIVSFVLFLFFSVLFLMQRNATEDAVHRNAVLTDQLARKASEIQTLKSENETLSQQIGKLENGDRSRVSSTKTTSQNTVNLQRQLNKLKSEIANKEAEIRRLRNSKNPTSQSQIDGSKSETIDQNAAIQQLKA